MKKRVWMAWSSGKDSAFALYELKRQPDVEVLGLFTTVNEKYDRVVMHAVRQELLELQAKQLGLPLLQIKIPEACSNELYEIRMKSAIDMAADMDITHMAFGDLFLKDVRKYRETMLGPTPVRPLFPLWGQNTSALAMKMIAIGQKAIITCVDPNKLPASFAGREFDNQFLEDLPEEVDPCGENGEFHSFVYESPLYRNPIKAAVGDVVERGGFIFADVFGT